MGPAAAECGPRPIKFGKPCTTGTICRSVQRHFLQDNGVKCSRFRCLPNYRGWLLSPRNESFDRRKTLIPVASTSQKLQFNYGITPSANLSHSTQRTRCRSPAPSSHSRAGVRKATHCDATGGMSHQTLNVSSATS